MSAAAVVPKKKETTASVVQPLLEQAKKHLGAYGKYVDQATPVVLVIANGIDTAYPHVVKINLLAQDAWKQIQPYGPEQYITLALGLFMCFFGGAYMLLIAAYEAVRLTVWQRLSASIKVLYSNYKKAQLASKKDDEIDADNNGVADVTEIGKDELMTRKILVFARAVDPDETVEAATALWTGFLTVLATMRLKLAQCITFGYAMGNTAFEAVGPAVQEGLHNALPPEFKKWAPRLTKQGFAFVGIIIAFMFQRVITAFHSAVQGGSIAVQAAIKLAKKKGMLPPTFEAHARNVNLASMALAAIGFYYQFSSGFAAPFPFNVLLLPMTIAEWLLSACVSTGLGAM
jgi:hypothetical protein